MVDVERVMVAIVAEVMVVVGCGVMMGVKVMVVVKVVLVMVVEREGYFMCFELIC